METVVRMMISGISGGLIGWAMADYYLRVNKQRAIWFALLSIWVMGLAGLAR